MKRNVVLPLRVKYCTCSRGFTATQIICPCVDIVVRLKNGIKFSICIAEQKNASLRWTVKWQIPLKLHKTNRTVNQVTLVGVDSRWKGILAGTKRCLMFIFRLTKLNFCHLKMYVMILAPFHSLKRIIIIIILWQLIRSGFLQSDWLIAGPYNTIRTTFFNFAEYHPFVKFPLFWHRTLSKFDETFGHFNTRQMICKH